MGKFEVNILGCGSALPTARHYPSTQILNIRDNLFMIDCGEGAQIQFRRMRLKFTRLGHIFLSHLHGDHCFGLIGMISTFALVGRTGELVIHAHPQAEQVFRPQLDFFCRDLPFTVRFEPVLPNRTDRPQLLILDEPINGLDPTKIKYVREVLKNMNEEDGTTILISSHILPELHQLATVYGFIHHGKMLQQITDKELDEKCRRHVHIEVDNVEKASCILDERYPESQIKVYLRNVIKVFGYNKNISDITKELVYGGVGVEKIGYEGEDLEEYYTNLLSEVKSNETA